MIWPPKVQAPRDTVCGGRLTLPLLLSALSLLALTGGCKSKGSVTVNLELPAAQELNPMADPRLASFGLILSDADGNVQKINTVPHEPDTRQLDIGELPVGSFDRLTLVGYSDTNQVLAYGESSALTVAAWDDLFVSLPLRKPYTYIAGGTSVGVFDTTQSHSGDVVSPIELNSPGLSSAAVATTPDGRYMLAAVGNPNAPGPANLLVFNTGQHTEAYRVPLNHSPDYLSVSPDGHWAILSATDASMITVVDMAQVFDGVDPVLATRDIVFAAPRQAAFVRGSDGGDRAVILRDPLAIYERCDASSTRSSLSVIDLPDGTLLNTTNFDRALADIASRPGDPRVFVADPCPAQISAFHTETYATESLATAQVPRSLIATRDTLWIGSWDESADVGTTAARIVIYKMDLTTLVANPVISTPFLQEGYVLKWDDANSSKVVLRANPRQVSVYHLSVPPGSSRVSALVFAEYYGDYRNDPITLVVPNISEVQYNSFSYVGLDTSSGEIRRRYRGLCWAIIDRDVDDLYCCEDLELYEGPRCNEGAFLPTGATSLFGVP